MKCILIALALLLGLHPLGAAENKGALNISTNQELQGGSVGFFETNKARLSNALTGTFVRLAPFLDVSNRVVTLETTVDGLVDDVAANTSDISLRLTITSFNTFTSTLPGLYQPLSTNLTQWALHPTSDFATAAQGAKADTALQSAATNNLVTGPATATDNAIAIYDGTTGKKVKDSATTLANVRDRSTHTGTQAASTITGLGTMATEPTNNWTRSVTNGNSTITVTKTNDIYYIVANGTTSSSASKATAQFRLSLVSGQSVVATNATNTTVYYTPHNGNAISLYDGTSTWTNATSAEISIAVPSTTNTLYDVFIYDTGSAITYDLVAWTDDSTRATALVMQDGVWVKSGATKRKYVGTFRTWTTLATVIDSDQHRLVFNHYNQTRKTIKVVDTTDSWTYATTAWRSLNNSTNNRINVVIGTVGNSASLRHYGQAGGSGTPTAYFGVGVNSTTVNSAQITGRNYNAGTTTTVGEWSGMLPAGFDFLQLIENSDGGTVTILGDNGKSYNQTGGVGDLWN